MGLSPSGRHDSNVSSQVAPAAADVAQESAPQSPPGEAPLLLIRPSPGWRLPDLGHLWRYRELLYFLVWRDIKVRYKQTVLGAARALLQPVMAMIVFTIFFGRLGGMSEFSDSPYPIFVYCGLLPWTFFAQAINQGAESLAFRSAKVATAPRAFRGELVYLSEKRVEAYKIWWLPVRRDHNI
jgi:hypothetical protein